VTARGAAAWKKRFFLFSSLFLCAAVILVCAAKAPAVVSLLKLDEKWTGDFDGMVKRHRIRVLVPYSKTFYFLDGADQRGLTYDFLMEFEKYINKKLKKQIITVQVVVIPTRRDRLLPALKEGLGDIAAGNLTITPERQKMVDFSSPKLTGVEEIIVTGPAAAPVKTIDDLAGKKIHVRASSSYYESLLNLNAKFRKEKKKPMQLVLADEYLEDEDLLEMMNAGLIPVIVIDNHKGKFWTNVFKNISLHPDVKVRTGGQIAWAIRKNNTQLKKVCNDFIKSHKKGSLMGNILFKRYLQDTTWVRNSLNEKEFQRFKDAVTFFRKYSEQYAFDWLMIAALAYQESRIDQSRRSPAGAIGIMQLLGRKEQNTLHVCQL
jgi:membrane-bound lytic murein transglycosylase MltF